MFLLGSFAAGLLVENAFAEGEKAPAHRLSEWKFGETLFGEAVSPDNLDGKVVVVEYWGVQCKSCVKSLAQLGSLDESLREKGLRVIGAEAYRSGRDQIAEVVKSQNVKFAITDGLSGPISISSLPHAVVFGVDGKVVFSGHPNDVSFEKHIRAALTGVRGVKKLAALASKAPLIAEREWKNSEGKPLVAAVSRIEGDMVIFKLKGGKEVPYEIKSLSSDDLELIEKSLKER
jgi:thiol-disulfide isomerase/thioredoxin